MPNRAGPPPVQNAAPQGQKDRLALVVSELGNREAQFNDLLGKEHRARWITVALHALAQNDYVLRSCTPMSIVEAIRESAALNLQPTGLLGEGWIIPYGDKATFQPGYRGYLKLLRNSGQIKTVDSQLVYMNDDFALSLGTDPSIHHVPVLYGEKGDDGTYLSDRGEYRGVYAYVRMNSGETVIEWMSWDDVMVVRSKSPSVQRGKQSPWDDFAGEMARKTVLRRLMKRLPLDSMPQVAHAATLDEEADVIEGQATEVTAAAPGRATAAAYALARGQADEESDQQRTPEKPTEAIVTTAELPSQMCAAPSPYGDGDVCVLAHGHPNNHRSDGGSWS